MICIIGGVALDIICTKDKFSVGTSNPAKITLGIGGVGCNIFQAITQVPCKFITALGNFSSNNFSSSFLKEKLTSLTSPTKQVVFLECTENAAPVYIAFMEQGKNLLAASDFSALKNSLTYNNLLPSLESITNSDLLALDANIELSELTKIINHANSKGIKYCFEGVSAEKMRKCMYVLKECYLLKVDDLEFNELVAHNYIHKYQSEMEITHIVKSLGKKGVELYSMENTLQVIKYFQPNNVLNIPDSTGAGDYLFAKICENIHLKQEIQLAITGGIEATENFLQQRIL